MAALLVRRDCTVEFGEPHPDLVVEDRFGVEIGCSRLDGPRDLSDAVRDAIDPSERTVGLWFGGHPLKISAEQTDRVVRQVRRRTPTAVPTSTAGPADLDYFEDLDLTVAVVTPRDWDDEGGVDIQFGTRGSALAPHVEEIERQIVNKMTIKASQAHVMPTLLFLDFTAVGSPGCDHHRCGGLSRRRVGRRP